MYRHFFKRVIDLFFSILGLLFLSLIFIPIVILIKLEDKGPIFYCAQRIGQHGKLFRMYKFRTMKVNSPDIRQSDGSTYNSENDPRVTKIGKTLRETSLDEIPQFINILVGQMSLIGPRPDLPDSLSTYPQEYLPFLKAKPGITGYNQAFFRNQSDNFEKMKHDLHYVRNLSFVFDVKILIKTVITVIKKEKVYRDNSLS